MKETFNQIEQFVEEHDLDTDDQMKALAEEVGELAEALNRGAPDTEIAMEAADVGFVAFSIANAEGYEAPAMSEVFRFTCMENLEKNTETDGNKVTKA